MSPSKLAPYLKFIVGLLSAVSIAVQAVDSSGKWNPVVTAVIGAVLTYLVPNLPAAVPVSTAPKETP